MADRADWRKCVSRSTGLPYYSMLGPKATGKGASRWLGFFGKTLKEKKRYFNVFTYETADTADAIPRKNTLKNAPLFERRPLAAKTSLRETTVVQTEDTPLIAAKRHKHIINIRKSLPILWRSLVK